MVEKLKIIGVAIISGRANEFFTLDQLIEVTGIDRISVRRVMEKLSREKLVVQIAKKPGYLLVVNEEKEWEGLGKGRPPLAITYKVKSREKLTQRVNPKQREGTAQEKMWSVLRNKQEADGFFTVKDVIVQAEAKRENARWYVKQLRRAGIVTLRRKGEWILVKDTGPKRPTITKNERRKTGDERGMKNEKSSHL